MYGYHYHKDGTIKAEKSYLSYSAIDLFRKNKQGYRDKYYLGKDGFSSQATVYGSEIHKMIEDGKIDVVNHPAGEYHNEFKLEAPVDGIPMLGYVDLLHKETYAVTDIKTGLKPWTSAQVQSLDQLPMYILLLRELGYKCSLTAHLVWLETHFVDGEYDTVSFQGFELERTVKPRHLALTGKQVFLSRRVYLHDLDRVRDIITSTAREIEQDFISWQKNN